MKYFYDIIFGIFSLVYMPYMLIKRKFNKDFFQRLGFFPDDLKRIKKPVWIHAVSVGEAQIAAAFAAQLKLCDKNLKIIISTTTRTGNELALSAGKGVVDSVFYFPLDLSFIVSSVIKRINPVAYIMVETEIWPNLIMAMKSNGVPVIMLNGRISDGSFRNYRKVRYFISPIVGTIQHFFMQTQTDADRIKDLGADAEKVKVTGNIKFSINKQGSKVYTKEMLGFNEDTPVLVAGSTHAPEENKLMRVYRTLKYDHPDIRFVLAPRHIDRIGSLRNTARRYGLKSRLFSEINFDKEYDPVSEDLLFVDTIGHLKDIYRVATIIFVGGSIAKKGGQNPIEGAVYGKPVIFGKHMENFREIANIFIHNNAAISIEDENDLLGTIRMLLTDKKLSMNMGKSAVKVVESNRDAMSKTVSSVMEIIGYSKNGKL